MRKTLDDLGAIYFAKAIGTGLTKVGFATNVKERISAIKVSSPVEIDLVGHLPATRCAEKALHLILAPHRVKGEWYPDALASCLYCDLGEMVEDVGVARWDHASVDSLGESIDEAFLTGAHIQAERVMIENMEWREDA